jgi:hypothetical protein
MVIINLTKAYLEDVNIPLIKRIRASLTFECYYATSLFAIKEYFKDNPPRKKYKVKKYKITSDYFAFVVIENIDIMQITENNSKDFNPKELSADKDYVRSFFYIKDSTHKEFAIYHPVDDKRFLESQEYFGFNDREYTTMPRLILFYAHNKKNGEGKFAISSRGLDQKPKQKKSLKDKILEFMPEPISELVPQPI